MLMVLNIKVPVDYEVFMASTPYEICCNLHTYMCTKWKYENVYRKEYKFVVMMMMMTTTYWYRKVAGSLIYYHMPQCGPHITN
jgi:hypothetical protein